MLQEPEVNRRTLHLIRVRKGSTSSSKLGYLNDGLVLCISARIREGAYGDKK